MDNSATSRSHLQQQSALLRSEIKQWEHEFKHTHGAKPTRDHIKQNPDIALKYLQYQQVRDRLDGPDPDLSPGAGAGPSPPSRKRTAAAAMAASLLATPSKRPRHAITPTRRNPGPAAEDDSPMVTPAVSRTLFSPAPPTSVGPTPQRDGRVLGLFDLLSSGGSAAAAAVAPAIETPSRRKKRPVAQGTPSRGGGGPDNDGDETPRTGRRRLLLRTPMSASRRQMLDAFVTTTPLRKGDENAAGGARTPSSVGGVSKLQFDTPAFLRRAPLPKIDENGDAYADLAPLRLPRKPFARGLSAIVASLRKVEEEALDDDLDALREMEAESMGVPRAKPVAAPDNDAGGDRPAMRKEAAAAEERRDMMAKDSQALLGGFDDEDMHDGPAEVQRGRDGQPLRVYKKKGQKRTTRLVKMKPTRSKRPAAEESGGDGGDSDPEHSADVVPETQPRDMAGPRAPGDTEGADPGSEAEFHAGSDDEDEDEDHEEEPADRARRKKAGAKKDKRRKEDQKGAEEAKKIKTNKNKKGGDKEGGDKKDSEGTVKKVARKVNEMAHTNFRRLKLRNSGAKGGPGYNSRFRRRK